MQDQEVVRLLFRLRTDSAGLLEDKKIYGKYNERCVLCESGAEEDVVNLLVMCGEFERNGWY